jgi:uncharacterized protein YjbI with pentapeptide repeats
MANPEHVALLKQGVEVWNAFRLENPAFRPDLKQVSGAGWSLIGVDFRDADLIGADLTKADLYLADLHGARLFGAQMSGANLYAVNLTQADLGNANLRGADISEAVLYGTALNGADLHEANCGETLFALIDFSKTLGLAFTTHEAPSSLGLDTIYASSGQIPHVFLRNVGVPESFIEYMASLTGKALEFYSCFISYSTADHSFAERLHADLQAKGVRCWFAPKDLKIGDHFPNRIDEAIRIFDKLLIVLSEHSIASQWVEEEVSAAFEKERKRKKTDVLFPIRLDDSVMDCDAQWAASLRRKRHIGDLRNWKDHDAYKLAFDRLLRDLQSKAGPSADASSAASAPTP